MHYLAAEKHRNLRSDYALSCKDLIKRLWIPPLISKDWWDAIVYVVIIKSYEWLVKLFAPFESDLCTTAASLNLVTE